MTPATASAAPAEMFRRFRFYPEEREVLRRREALTPVQWAERNLVLPGTRTARPGPWRASVVPYVVEPLETIDLPHTRKIILCWTEQTTKSTVGHAYILGAADRDPGPAMVVMPDEKAAGRAAEEKIIPLINSSPAVRAILAPGGKSAGKLAVKFASGMSILLAWANSPSMLAAQSIRYLFIDETDKFNRFAGREADPVDLAEARTSTFEHTHKIIKASTPTYFHGYIWVALTTEADELRCYEVCCPSCGEHQLMRFRHIRWPESIRDPREMRRKKAARYHCQHCGARWDDFDRDRALEHGRWRPYRWDKDEGWFKPAPPVPAPPVVGFHLPGWCSPFISLSECAARFLESKDDKAKLMRFYNRVKCLPFEDWGKERDEEAILDLCGAHEEGEVPAEADVLLATVDRQHDGYWYVLRAWEFGRGGRSWLVRAGFVEMNAPRRAAPESEAELVAEIEALEQGGDLLSGETDPLAALLFGSAWVDREGVRYPIAAGRMDSGDQPKAVYDWCRDHPPFQPLKGSGVIKDVFTFSKLKSHPSLKLMNVNVQAYKDALAAKLQVPLDQPGAFILHAGTSRIYAAQMCAEYRDEQGRWVCPPGRANHLWDCEVYQLALADSLGLRFRAKPGAAPEDQAGAPARARRQPRRPPSEMPRKKPSWLRNRR
jgi:phage terminase large subunit GpA-like protein